MNENNCHKFRVFDHDLGKYIDTEGLVITADGELMRVSCDFIETDDDAYATSVMEKLEGDFTIERGTGQHDRNDKPIYAGDVVVQPNRYPYFDYAEGVEHKSYYETLGEIEHDAVPNYIGIVEWDDEDCAFVIVLQCVNPNKSGISNGISYHFSDVQGLEVIGNKHELVYKNE